MNILVTLWTFVSLEGFWTSVPSLLYNFKSFFLDSCITYNGFRVPYIRLSNEITNELSPLKYTDIQKTSTNNFIKIKR